MENIKHRILFVCLGNICRSPAAEGVFRSIVEREGDGELFEIDSAGTYGGHAGNLPDPRMRAVASTRGYNLTHRSRQLVTDDFERFDLIVVMDDSNYDNVRRLAPDPEAVEKVVRMVDFSRRFDIDHVPDPYYEGHEGFVYVMDILEDACAGLYDLIKVSSMKLATNNQ